MRIAKVKLRGISNYSQSKHHETPKLDKEIPKDYEERTWRNRLNIDTRPDKTSYGCVVVSPMAIKNCLSEAAKFLSIQIPGKGKATYTKHFESGVMVLEPMVLTEKGQPIKPENVLGEWFFVPSDGRRGGSTRVNKCFPCINAGWEGEIEIYILDDTITSDVFLKHLQEAGKFIGIGRFRPRNNGFYGRFEVTDCKVVSEK